MLISLSSSLHVLIKEMVKVMGCLEKCWGAREKENEWRKMLNCSLSLDTTLV
jgi:hypothetical protein